jgi:hypothetical protein
MRFDYETGWRRASQASDPSMSAKGTTQRTAAISIGMIRTLCPAAEDRVGRRDEARSSERTIPFAPLGD